MNDDRLVLTASGQALLHETVSGNELPEFLELVERIRRADVAFTNFEAACAPDPSAVSPERHPAPVEALVDLKWMGFDLVSLANNHAVEGGTDGVTYTRAQALAAGLTPAGTGTDLVEAQSPSFLNVKGRRIALIAMDTANLQTKIAVANGQPGVNPLRGSRTGDGILRNAWIGEGIELNADDAARNLAVVEEAASQADIVLVSIHEHLWPAEWKDVAFRHRWPEDWRMPMEWKRTFSRQLIDAGASAVLAHGMPRACAIELHRGRPIFHSLGNLLFHLHVDAAWPNPDVWEGMIADIAFDGTQVSGIELTPVVLIDRDGYDHVQSTTRRWAKIDSTQRGQHVLERVAADSAAVGTHLTISQGKATLAI